MAAIGPVALRGLLTAPASWSQEKEKKTLFEKRNTYQTDTTGSAADRFDSGSLYHHCSCEKTSVISVAQLLLHIMGTFLGFEKARTHPCQNIHL